MAELYKQTDSRCGEMNTQTLTYTAFPLTLFSTHTYTHTLNLFFFQPLPSHDSECS